jgi:hypothetical protein
MKIEGKIAANLRGKGQNHASATGYEGNPAVQNQPIIADGLFGAQRDGYGKDRESWLSQS